MEIKKDNLQSKYDLIKDFTQEVLDLNYKYKDIEDTLSYYSKEFNSTLFINNTQFENLENFLNSVLTNEEAVQLINDFLSKDVRLVKIYFNSILDYSPYSSRSKKVNNDNLQIALNKLFNNYKELEEIIFKYALLKVENINHAYFMHHNDVAHLHYVKADDTCFKVFPQQFINNVWHKYKDQLIKRARRGPKMMLILNLLYDKFFTPEICDILIDRMQGYKNIFYIDYLIKCSKYLNEDQIYRLKSLKLTLKLL